MSHYLTISNIFGGLILAIILCVFQPYVTKKQMIYVGFAVTISISLVVYIWALVLYCADASHEKAIAEWTQRMHDNDCHRTNFVSQHNAIREVWTCRDGQAYLAPDLS
jgi:hypothetical protein